MWCSLQSASWIWCILQPAFLYCNTLHLTKKSFDFFFLQFVLRVSQPVWLVWVKRRFPSQLGNWSSSFDGLTTGRFPLREHGHVPHIHRSNHRHPSLCRRPLSRPEPQLLHDVWQYSRACQSNGVYKVNVRNQDLPHPGSSITLTCSVSYRELRIDAFAPSPTTTALTSLGWLKP
jgi:hypothetical protein